MVIIGLAVQMGGNRLAKSLAAASLATLAVLSSGGCRWMFEVGENKDFITTEIDCNEGTIKQSVNPEHTRQSTQPLTPEIEVTRNQEGIQSMTMVQPVVGEQTATDHQQMALDAYRIGCGEDAIPPGGIEYDGVLDIQDAAFSKDDMEQLKVEFDCDKIQQSYDSASLEIIDDPESTLEPRLGENGNTISVTVPVPESRTNDETIVSQVFSDTGAVNLCFGKPDSGFIEQVQQNRQQNEPTRHEPR